MSNFLHQRYQPRDHVGYQAHDGGCQKDAEDDGREGFPEFDAEHGGDKRAGPSAGARQGDADKEDQTPEFVLFDLVLFAYGALFQLFDHGAEGFGLFQQVKDLRDQKEHEGHGQHVAENAEDKRPEPRQAEEGRRDHPAAQFQDRDHGDDETDDIFWNAGKGFNKPVDQ